MSASCASDELAKVHHSFKLFVSPSYRRHSTLSSSLNPLHDHSLQRIMSDRLASEPRFLLTVLLQPPEACNDFSELIARWANNLDPNASKPPDSVEISAKLNRERAIRHGNHNDISLTWLSCHIHLVPTLSKSQFTRRLRITSYLNRNLPADFFQYHKKSPM